MVGACAWVSSVRVEEHGSVVWLWWVVRFTCSAVGGVGCGVVSFSFDAGNHMVGVRKSMSTAKYKSKTK